MDDVQQGRYDRVTGLTRAAAARVAAVAALTAVLLVGCGDPSDETGSTTVPTGATTSNPTSTTTTTVVEAVDYHRLGSPRVLTRGYLGRSSPDGTALFVLAVDPDLSQLGCEGQPEPITFRAPTDGGARQPVLVDGATTRGTLVRGPGGRVALVQGCEGFVSEVLVGSEAADGTLGDLRPLPLFREQGRLAGFGWSNDGQRLLAGRNNLTQETPADVVSVDPATGEVTLVFTVDGDESRAVTQVAQLADGTYVVAGFGSVSLRGADGTVSARTRGFGFEVNGGSTVAAYGEGIVLLTSGGPRTVVPAGPGATVITAAFSPDGAALVYTIGVDGVESVAITTLVDDRTTTVEGPPARHLRALFTGDGRALAFNRQADPTADPGADPEVVLVPVGG